MGTSEPAAAIRLKTMAVVRLLATTYYTLSDMIRFGRIPPPGKDSSGDYVWSDADVEAARRVLAERAERRRQTATLAHPEAETRTG